MDPRQKLYCVTRQDLSSGAQAIQCGHALVEFGFAFPEVFKLWYEKSNYLCYLSVKDEEALKALLHEAKSREIPFKCFYEPDFDNALTAVAFSPMLETRRLVSGLPLALK